MTPDPKPGRRRIIDRDAMAICHLSYDECASCRRQPSNAHHVLERGAGGDDVVENLVGICGSGSARCHGAAHGSPYVDERGKRWTRTDVLHAIGRHLVRSRPDTINYIVARLGDIRGPAYLRDHYGLSDDAIRSALVS